MEELTLITEEREYVPGYGNPGGNPEEFIKYFTTIGEAESELGPINWYIGDKPPYKYGPEDECFYCIAPAIMFKVTKLTDGKLIGYPVCRTHAGREVMFEYSSNPGEPIGSNFHSLMLHAVAEMYGPGGIVVDEAKAKATSCECVEYKPAKYIAVDNAFNRANYPEEIGKVYDSPPSYVAVEKVEGKYWCTSKGVVGALTDEQEKIYCNPRVMVERPGVRERMVKWSEAVETCRAQLPPTDGRTRLEIYLDCMSRELKKVGVEA